MVKWKFRCNTWGGKTCLKAWGMSTLPALLNTLLTVSSQGREKLLCFFTPSSMWFVLFLNIASLAAMQSRCFKKVWSMSRFSTVMRQRLFSWVHLSPAVDSAPIKIGRVVFVVTSAPLQNIYGKYKSKHALKIWENQMLQCNICTETK